MRGSLCALALAGSIAAASAAVAASPDVDCPPAAAATIAPDAGPYMKNLRMHEPMPGEMKKDGMMKDEVMKGAMRKDRCMQDALSKEQLQMDETKGTPKSTQ